MQLLFWDWKGRLGRLQVELIDHMVVQLIISLKETRKTPASSGNPWLKRGDRRKDVGSTGKAPFRAEKPMK